MDIDTELADYFTSVFLTEHLYGNHKVITIETTKNQRYHSILCSDILRFMRQKNRGQVIIPDKHPNPPLPHEVNMASVLAQHFQTVVSFIVPLDDYKRKSADIMMHGVE